MVFIMAHKRQRIIAGLIVLLVLLASLLPELNPALAQSCPTPTITITPSSLSSGEVITIQGEGWLPSGGGVIVTAPEAMPTFDLKIMAVTSSGKVGPSRVVIEAPPGDYEILFSQSQDGCELSATAVLTVTGEGSAPPTATPTPAPPEQGYSLTASPSTAAFGGTITVNWTAPADHADNDWIAFYKVGNGNNTYLTFQRPTPGATSGTLTFTAPYPEPTAVGQYEFRYLPKDEFTDVARSNTVTLGPGYTLTASPSTVAPGENITVNWRTPEGHPSNDYIALYKAEDPNQTYQTYQYVPEGTGGSLTFTIPATATAGQYEFRYLPLDRFIDVARVGITVTGKEETNLVANAGPDQTVPGPSPVDVQFDGSGSTGDIVSYKWYNQRGQLRAEGVTPVITVNFGRNPKAGATRTFTLVVTDSQGNTAQDEVTITLGETPTEGEQRTITVPGNQPWTDTGLDLAVGASVSITASGTIKVAPQDPGKTPAGDPNCIGPSGRKIDPTAETWLTPGLTCWSLVGRIGEDGTPFQIGTSVSISIETAGRLYLGINDEKGRFGNNSGSWIADITVGGAATGESSPPFNPQVQILRFFESGYEDLPLEQRVYAERFASETTRYINWQLDLEHPAPGRRVDFQITAVYYRWNEAGSVAFWEEFHRHTVDTYVEGDWTFTDC